MTRPKQMTLAAETGAGFERYRNATKHDIFLDEMDRVVPWNRRLERIS